MHRHAGEHNFGLSLVVAAHPPQDAFVGPWLASGFLFGGLINEGIVHTYGSGEADKAYSGETCRTSRCAGPGWACTCPVHTPNQIYHPSRFWQSQSADSSIFDSVVWVPRDTRLSLAGNSQPADRLGGQYANRLEHRMSLPLPASAHPPAPKVSGSPQLLTSLKFGSWWWRWMPRTWESGPSYHRGAPWTTSCIPAPSSAGACRPPDGTMTWGATSCWHWCWHHKNKQQPPAEEWLSQMRHSCF